MASFWSSKAEERALPLTEPRRYLVLNLPRWATDCLKRADPALAGLGRPLVLWERVKGAMRLAAIDHLASAAGLKPGQSLSDARALIPGLEAREIDHAYLEHVFAEFADWHSNASPIVSVHSDMVPYGDLVLDITGVTHLFGGESRMLSKLTNRLEVLGFTVAGAIASTVGAAWAMAHLSSGRIVAEGEETIALAELPVAALRLDETCIAGLQQLGLKRVGQLYGRDRKSLQARFGAPLLGRLDQALGQVEERINPRIPVAEYFADRRFADPIGLMDDVLMCAGDLAIQLAIRLEAEGVGAQSFHLLLYRVDHKVMSLSVNAARATRDARHITRLFQHRSERIGNEYDPGFGIDMIRLAASSVSPIDNVQVGAFETDDGAADLDKLYDRMTSRLGPLSVVRSKFINTHIPERAVVVEPIMARTPDDPAAMPADPAISRPLRLLPMPEPIAVIAEVPDGPPVRMVWRRVGYKFIKASGPERIEAEWQRTVTRLSLTVSPLSPEREAKKQAAQSKKPARPDPRDLLAPFEPDKVLRDYYVAEDEGGRRFWLFRQGIYGLEAAPRWFLHGFFS